MADRGDRRAVAGAHAGARTTRTSLPSIFGRFGEQPLRAGHGAGQRIAHPHRDRRRRRAVLHHIEMRIEGRDLVDFGERELHLRRQRSEMRRGEMAVVVLDQMQMLDQQIAPARPVDQQRLHFFKRLRIDLAAFGRPRRPAAAGRGCAFTSCSMQRSFCSPDTRRNRSESTLDKAHSWMD